LSPELAEQAIKINGLAQATDLHCELPAVIAMIACAYFVINTGLVSGVLSLLQASASPR